MSNVITLGNSVLANSGKRGVLKPIECTPGGDYYLLNAGGFNIKNRGGITYPVNDYISECMDPNSDFGRRVTEGQMQMELGHPPMYYHEMVNGILVRTKITDVFEWVQRLRTIEDDRVCGHIRKVHFEMTGGPKDPVYNRIEVAPFGVNKQVFEDSLKNPDINTAVSIRSVTKPQKFGDTTKQVEYWSTYDLVIEQGMLNACKHRTSGLEDYLSSGPLNMGNCEMYTTMDELLTYADEQLASDAIQQRMAGNESFDSLKSMISELKQRNRHSKKVTIQTSNSLSVF